MTYHLDIFRTNVIKPDDPDLEIALDAEFNRRRMKVSFEDRSDEASELVVSLSNRDRFFLMPERGARLFEGKLFVSFQYGFENPDNAFDTLLSPWRTFPFSDISSVTEDSIEVRFISPTAQKLISAAAGKMFEGRTISSVANEIAAAIGYPESNRVIQDTTHLVSNLVITGQDSWLANLLRIGNSIGYVFYETVDRNGNPIFHFHKPGFRPSVLAPLSSRPTSTPVEALRTTTPSVPEATAQGSGFFANRSGIITYLDPPPLVQGTDSIAIIDNVISFVFRYDSTGVPASLNVRSIDLDTGKTLSGQEISELGLGSKSLSKRSPYNEPSNVSFIDKVKQFFGVGGSPKKEEEQNLPADARVSIVFGGEDAPATPAMLQVTYGAGVQSEEQARSTGEAALEKAQLKTTTCDLTIVGEPRVMVGQIWYLIGFGIFSGDYLVKSCRHEKGTGGFTTSLTMTTDGVDSILGGPSRSAPEKEQERASLRVRIEGPEQGEVTGTTVYGAGSSEE